MLTISIRELTAHFQHGVEVGENQLHKPKEQGKNWEKHFKKHSYTLNSIPVYHSIYPIYLSREPTWNNWIFEIRMSLTWKHINLMFFYSFFYVQNRCLFCSITKVSCPGDIWNKYFPPGVQKWNIVLTM